MYAEQIVFLKDMDYSARCHHSTTSPSIAESLDNIVNPERHPLRKSAARSAICKLQLHKFPEIQRITLQTTEFVRVLTGHYCWNR